MRPRFLSIVIALMAASAAHASEATVAVAANFSAPMQQIAAEFEKDSGHKVSLSFAGTGKFYAQIRNGAPFQVLLAADDETPARLEQEGMGVAGSRFTYAIGRLVLWSARPGFVDSKGAVLNTGRFNKLALANPKLAPYGLAAIETLTRLGLLTSLQSRFVQGENIAQVWQFASTGNADLGFVALSQVLKEGVIGSGSAWLVPDSLHAPIRQDALLLARGKGQPAAEALLKYLKSNQARVIIKSYGYDL